MAQKPPNDVYRIVLDPKMSPEQKKAALDNYFGSADPGGAAAMRGMQVQYPQQAPAQVAPIGIAQVPAGAPVAPSPAASGMAPGMSPGVHRSAPMAKTIEQTAKKTAAAIKAPQVTYPGGEENRSAFARTLFPHGTAAAPAVAPIAGEENRGGITRALFPHTPVDQSYLGPATANAQADQIRATPVSYPTPQAPVAFQRGEAPLLVSQPTASDPLRAAYTPTEGQQDFSSTSRPDSYATPVQPTHLSYDPDADAFMTDNVTDNTPMAQGRIATAAGTG